MWRFSIPLQGLGAEVVFTFPASTASPLEPTDDEASIRVRRGGSGGRGAKYGFSTSMEQDTLLCGMETFPIFKKWDFLFS